MFAGLLIDVFPTSVTYPYHLQNTPIYKISKYTSIDMLKDDFYQMVSYSSHKDRLEYFQTTSLKPTESLL